MSSKCKNCGEFLAKTGNYTVRILPAKRIPKKARKLMTTMMSHDSDGSDQTNFSIETNSFQKFLLKRTKPYNMMELTCGKCEAVTKIKMFKISQEEKKEIVGGKVKESTKNLMSPSIALSSSASRKSKKRNRDISAGLTFTLKTSSSSASLKPASDGETNSSKATSSPSSSISLDSNPRKRQISAFQKQKEMNNLKKILFHSKKAKKSGSSLQDFLSGI